MNRPHGFGEPLALLLASALLFGACRSPEPESYEECVAQATADRSRSEAELVVIVRTCKARFPAPPSTPLPPFEVARLDGRAGRGSDPRTFVGTIYNPTEWTITALEIMVRPKPSEDSRYTPLHTERNYRVTELEIPPLTAGNFSVAILADDYESELEWNILGAEGRLTEPPP